MPTTHNDLTSGEYHDVTFELVTDRSGGPVTRGRVHQARTDGGDRLWFVPASGTDHDWEPGRRYDIADALGYDPTGGSLPPAVERLRREDWRCPECGESTEFKPDLVAPAADVVAELDDRGIEEPVLVETERTTVTSRTVADEWTFPDGIGAPGDRGRSRDRRGIDDVPGEFVCPHCGHVTDEPERRPVVREHLDAEVEERITANASAGAPTAAAEPAPETLGMATGGAKDVTNFRDNIEEGYLPQREAISDEGLFYDYYFDTGEGAASDGLFYPTYSAAVSEHPLTDETERYLTVGLNSTLTEDDFERKPLNLVAVLDVSGSMSSPFDQYYYDEHGRRREIEDPSAETKMEAATQSLVALTHQLEDDDRFGVVLFNGDAGVAKPVRDVASTDMDAIRGHIREIAAGGGTNMAGGFERAREMLDPYEDADPAARENRVVFMTDAMPNLGRTGEADLVDLIEGAAEDGVYTTFVGMGLDSNAELIDALSGVRGANHYFVHSAEEFERRLGEEFAFMVTPLVFDLSVDVVADGYEIDEVYGSPDADAATGEVMHVTTLFPSASEDGENRGGVILLKLRGTGADPDVDLEASWVRRDGTAGTDVVSVTFPGGDDERFENTGVRKAVLLARYADLLREWVDAVRSGPPTGKEERAGEVDDWQLDSRSEWEQESVPLQVPGPYGEEFRRFHDHLVAEMEAIGDENLQQEADLLQQLVGAGNGD